MSDCRVPMPVYSKGAIMKTVRRGIIIRTNMDIPEEEIDAYIDRGFEKLGDNLRTINIVIDGDYVDLEYSPNAPGFDRIRRITGYLVGTLDRFNDAKRSEESERVKHGVR